MIYIYLSKLKADMFHLFQHDHYQNWLKQLFTQKDFQTDVTAYYNALTLPNCLIKILIFCYCLTATASISLYYFKTKIVIITVPAVCCMPAPDSNWPGPMSAAAYTSVHSVRPHNTACVRQHMSTVASVDTPVYLVSVPVTQTEVRHTGTRWCQVRPGHSCAWSAWLLLGFNTKTNGFLHTHLQFSARILRIRMRKPCISIERIISCI